MLSRFYSRLWNSSSRSSESDLSYNRFRNSKHIFIFGVLGRSSTTALQRILNSSEEITVSGESKGIVAQLLHTLKSLSLFHDEFRDNYERFEKCFAKKKHTRIYPMALNTEECSDSVRHSIVALLKHLHGGLRFGFQDIEVGSEETLESLLQLFPKSKFVFLFREPGSQFQSVQAQDYWDYSKSIVSFIEKYVSLANLYIQFHKKNKTGIFLENTSLRDPKKVDLLLRKLSVSSYDKTLIGDNVFSARNKIVDIQRDSEIGNSKAYRTYLRLRELSSF